ncbi:hypothetical protein OM075_05180 [Marinilabiliaceae bacterium AAT]|uniref:Uncharacterized protein n=2 Tax=Plebeiibacterium sediminum TaxID=2992112 RepID=A0AAE3M2X4_9BACT|nr:hypothetical protein [Plebeiobacterium sediminum]
MLTKKLSAKEINYIHRHIIPYRDNLILSLIVSFFILLIVLGINASGFYADSKMFSIIKWSLSPLLITIALIVYVVKIKSIRKDLKIGTKYFIISKIDSKANEKYGTYSSGNYLANGSSNRMCLIFDEYKYYCSNDEYLNFNIGDKINAYVAPLSKIVLSIDKP